MRSFVHLDHFRENVKKYVKPTHTVDASEIRRSPVW